MDQVFELVHAVMPVLYIIAILAIIAKIVVVSLNKGFNLPAIIVSFFKIYGKSQLTSDRSARRKNYMRANNYLNYCIYTVFILFVLMLITYQGNVFIYN
ncbi:MAG TPA: hypothetical protein VHB48_06225 [Chitinophagaceae bacterium]|nr:hypothetical protein [Chitinophagaceae bacterium]